MKTQRGFDSSFGQLTQIIKTNGLKGLYVGMGSTAQREVGGEILYFVTYDAVTRWTKKKFDPSHPLYVYAPAWVGALAGLSYAIGLYPVDTIKSKLQADSSTNPKYKGIVDCFN